MSRDKDQISKASGRSYLIGGCVALVLIAVIAAIRGVFGASSGREAAGILSDSCLIPGILLSGAGGLGYAAYKGAYDSFGYLFRKKLL